MAHAATGYALRYVVRRRLLILAPDKTIDDVRAAVNELCKGNLTLLLFNFSVPRAEGLKILVETWASQDIGHNAYMAIGAYLDRIGVPQEPL